jgi:hypothetical protein
MRAVQPISPNHFRRIPCWTLLRRPPPARHYPSSARQLGSVILRRITATGRPPRMRSHCADTSPGSIRADEFDKYGARGLLRVKSGAIGMSAVASAFAKTGHAGTGLAPFLM